MFSLNCNHRHVFIKLYTICNHLLVFLKLLNFNFSNHPHVFLKLFIAIIHKLPQNNVFLKWIIWGRHGKSSFYNLPHVFLQLLNFNVCNCPHVFLKLFLVTIHMSSSNYSSLTFATIPMSASNYSLRPSLCLPQIIHCSHSHVFLKLCTICYYPPVFLYNIYFNFRNHPHVFLTLFIGTIPMSSSNYSSVATIPISSSNYSSFATIHASSSNYASVSKSLLVVFLCLPLFPSSKVSALRHNAK